MAHDDDIPKELWDSSATGRINSRGDKEGLIFPTGRFKRPSKAQRDPYADLDSPTQKIIIFPQPQETKPSKNPHPSATAAPPPILFTAPLPKIQDLPPDFLEEDELDELYDPRMESPDFRQYLQGEQEDTAALDFSQEENKLASLLRDLERKADSYADSMFQEAEETDWAAIERVERLIPGTDQEDGKRVAPSRERVKLPKLKKAPQDVHPSDLLLRFRKQLSLLIFQRGFLASTTLLSLVISFRLLPPLQADVLPLSQQILLLLGLLAISSLGMCDVLFRGLRRCFTLRAGMDSLACFSGIFCALDCLVQYGSTQARGQVPLVSLVLLQYFFLAYGEEMKCRGNMTSCKVAEKVREPFLLTAEPRKWNNRYTYTKSSAPPRGFGSQILADDGAQLVFSLSTPVFLLLSLLMARNLTKEVEDFLWAISTLLVVSFPLASAFLFSRPYKKVADRLKHMHTAVAGWQGVSVLCNQCSVGDSDLFSPQDIRITGNHQYNGNSEKKVLAYTAALLQEGELGTAPLFLEIMTARGQRLPRCREVMYHDAGGISGKIGADQVMVGGAAFTELMNVPIPEGLFLNHAIFCSINGKLAGFYALEYSLQKIIAQSLESIQLEHIRPVLVTRDFAITPEILRRRFKLQTLRLDFPSVLRRHQLSSGERPKQGVLTGVMVLDGLESVADCVVGAKRLRKAVYQGVALSLVSASLGFFLVAYLVASSAYNSLSLENMLIFMLLWMLPTAVLSDVAHRF